MNIRKLSKVVSDRPILFWTRTALALVPIKLGSGLLLYLTYVRAQIV